MDQIIIRDLVVYGIVGVNDWERQSPRQIIINLTIYTDLQKAANTDDIEETVDYSFVAKRVKALVESANRRTLEALAEDIADLCLGIPKVMSVRVSVEKPGAIQYARTAGVELERNRVK